MNSLVEALTIGGPVAVLAGIIFLMYVRDRKDTEKRWGQLSDDLIRCRDKESTTREEHTKALTELTTLLLRLNGK